MERTIELSQEAKDYCMSHKDKKGNLNCGKCKLHSLCRESYPLTWENLNNHIDKFNKAFKSIN